MSCDAPFSYNKKMLFYLFQLLKHVTIASGGVIPRIHPELLVRKKGGKVVSLVKPAGKPSAISDAKTSTLIKPKGKTVKPATPAKVKPAATKTPSAKKAAKAKPVSVY